MSENSMKCHGYLRRLVEATWQSTVRDPMRDFRVFSGLESIHPGLESFQSLSKGAKQKWLTVTSKDLKDSELAKEIFDTIAVAYKPLGGHVNIKGSSDIAGEVDFIIGVDVDDDPQPDAVLLGKHREGGKVKLTAMGHDGTPLAKKWAMDQWVELLQNGKAFAEVSGALAHILLTRHQSVVAVQSQKDVERILGKVVRWIGRHPSGKYPDHPFWYTRVMGGQEHTKILIGKFHNVSSPIE